MSKYQELVKSFDNIRKISQDFFIYGYNGRGDFPFVSDRMYDNELRRIKSYLKNFVKTTQTKDKKTISISSNTVYESSNPLFPLFYGKSFTTKDCFLHFTLIDILADYQLKSLNEIYDELIEEYDCQDMDIMTVRNKLHEYSDLGLINIFKKGKKNVFSLQKQITLDDDLIDAIVFFQNILPCGYILTPITKNKKSNFLYKQVFFSNVLDDEYVLVLLKAIEEKASIAIKQRGKRNQFTKKGVPSGIYHNMITGRRYVKLLHKETYSMIRIDKIDEINYLEYNLKIEDTIDDLKTISVIIHVDDSEQFIIERIYREIDKDNIDSIDDNTYRLNFKTSNLYDLIPYIRTYFGRIVYIECSDKLIEKKIKQDLMETLDLYNDGEEDVSWNIWEIL